MIKGPFTLTISDAQYFIFYFFYQNTEINTEI